MAIERVGDISHREFMREFYEPGLPVVFTDAARVWGARELFTPAWFAEQFGGRITEVRGRAYTMREVVSQLSSGSAGPPAAYPYSFSIPRALPELLPLLAPLHLNYAKPNWLDNKFFSLGNWGAQVALLLDGAGGKASHLNLACHHLNTWTTQLYGEKQFAVFPRGPAHLPQPGAGPQTNDATAALLREATPAQVALGPGETLFLPFGTWHTAHALAPAISVAFDQLSGKNYPGFLRGVWACEKPQSTLKAVALYGYAWVAGQVCRLGEKAPA